MPLLSFLALWKTEAINLRGGMVVIYRWVCLSFPLNCALSVLCAFWLRLVKKGNNIFKKVLQKWFGWNYNINKSQTKSKREEEYDTEPG